MLHFHEDNMEFSSQAKLAKVAQNLTLKMKLKAKVSKLFFAYLANYLLMRPALTAFAPACVALFEDIVTGSIADISQAHRTDAEFLLFVLVVCQEIFMHQFHSGKKVFSDKFLRFFRKLSFLTAKRVWRQLLEALRAQTLAKNALFYFFDPHAPNAGEFYNKTPLNREEQLLLFLMQTAFFLLRQPHTLVLTNFICVSQDCPRIPISRLISLSTFMEKSISSVYTSNRFAEPFPKPPAEPSLLFALSRATRFLSPSDAAPLLELPLLCRRWSRHFRKLCFGKLLSERQPLSCGARRKLYEALIVLDAEDFYGSLAQSLQLHAAGGKQDSGSIVKMDVERTKFFQGDREQLIKLLVNVGEYIPSVGYFQGLNCMGAFVLDYFADFAFSFDIISFCLHKHMKRYFFGDFHKLNKLVFIGESLVREFFPDIYASLEATGIGHGYYLSSLVLTVFFSVLQFCECGEFVLLALDLYVSEGWAGFFKVGSPGAHLFHFADCRPHSRAAPGHSHPLHEEDALPRPAAPRPLGTEGGLQRAADRQAETRLHRKEVLEVALRAQRLLELLLQVQKGRERAPDSAQHDAALAGTAPGAAAALAQRKPEPDHSRGRVGTGFARTGQLADHQHEGPRGTQGRPKRAAARRLRAPRGRLGRGSVFL